MDTDPDLLRRYADSRDQAAFAELVNRHLGLVHATALRVLGGDTHLAQDVAQGAFAELARQARALGGRDTLAGWLHHTARFLALNAVRAERRRKEREQEAHAMNETDTTPDAAWERFAPVLDDADRDALLLRFFEDKSHREVGAQLGLGEDAARMRVARALDKLRAHFSKRGVTTTTALLSLTLGVHGSTPAPAGLAASVVAKALAAKGGVATVGTVKASLTAKWLAATAAIVIGLAVFFLGENSRLPSGSDQPSPSAGGATRPTLRVFAPEFESAATSTNQTGLNLFWLVASADPGGNVLISPYSIVSALAMTYVGADGETRDEMARVLNFPDDDDALAASFNGLRANLNTIAANAAALSARGARRGLGPAPPPIEWHIANRLFGQTGYGFRQPFLDYVRDRYRAPMQLLDFKSDPDVARLAINQWVADQTKGKIPGLIPGEAVRETTRLALVNALYLKAAWEHPFSKRATSDRPFKVRGAASFDVPTMASDGSYGYAKRESYTAVALPYHGSGLQFLILLPDDPAGVDALAATITPAKLTEFVWLEPRPIRLRLPKLKLQAPTINLTESFQTLGLKTAFDLPRGSANFDRMAPRNPADYLRLETIFHQAVLSLDEEGTEATAATSIRGGAGGGPRELPPEVFVDRPSSSPFRIERAACASFSAA